MEIIPVIAKSHKSYHVLDFFQQYKYIYNV